MDRDRQKELLHGVVDRAEMERIHAIVDDSQRNNEITLGYHRLSEQIADFTGSAAVNWCAWAKWTSKTIGVGIRWGEVRDLAHKRVDAQSDRIFNRWVGTRALSYTMMGTLLRFQTWANRYSSKRLADGNKDVFYEVGMNCVEMMEAFGRSDSLDTDAVEAHLAKMVPLGPAKCLVEGVPLDDMQAAIRYFVYARFAIDDEVRDALVLAGNIHLAAYEQARLQAVVTASLWSSVTGMFRPIVAMQRVVPRPLRGPVGYPFKKARNGMRWGMTRLATKYSVCVITKEEVIPLGRRLRPTHGATEVFPAPEDDPTVPELVAALERFCTPCDVDKPLARLWSVYEQRVHFTGALFRSRHHTEYLRLPPMDQRELDEVVVEERDPAIHG